MNLTIFSIDAIEEELYEIVKKEDLFKNALQPTTEWTIRLKNYFFIKFNNNDELIWMFSPESWTRFGHIFPEHENLVRREFLLDIISIEKTNMKFALGTEIEWMTQAEKSQNPEEQRKFDNMREFLEKVYALKFDANEHNKIIDCLFDFSKLVHVNPNYRIMICAPKNEEEQAKLLQYFTQIINSHPKEQIVIDNFLLVFLSRISKDNPLYFKTYKLELNNDKFKLIMKRCELIT